jgi:Flp pilus assembly protein TadG
MENKTRRILWIVMAILVIILIVVYAFFMAAKEHKTQQAKLQQAQQSQAAASAATINHQQYTQYNAPKGQTIGGFPSNLLPAAATITSSYHNQYTGLEQYTVNAKISESMTSVYNDYQKLLQSAGYTIGKTTTSDKVDTINASQGSNYIAIQLTPESASSTNIVANYGVPSAAPAKPAASTSK